MESQSTGLAGEFPETRWTSIFRASNLDQTVGREALNRLVERYRAPLLAHIMGKFHADTGQAEDWLHSFLLERILEKDLLKCARADRGSFRGFLCKSLDNFVKDQIRRENRDCRRPASGFVRLDEAPETATPGPVRVGDSFDLAWAKNVLVEAETQTREFYVQKDRSDLWNIFNEGFLQAERNGTDPPSMAELAVRFGFLSGPHASRALVTAKRKFRQCLRAVISEYAEGDAAIDAEIRELTAILYGASL